MLITSYNNYILLKENKENQIFNLYQNYLKQGHSFDECVEKICSDLSISKEEIENFLNQNKNLTEGLIDFVRQGIGNKQIDKILDNYQKEMIDLQNQMLSAKYGDKVKNFLLKGGNTPVDQITKEISELSDKDKQKNYEEMIANLKKTIEPQDSGDKTGKKPYYINDQNGKPMKITKRMGSYLKTKLSSVNLNINKEVEQILNKLQKQGVEVADKLKNLKTTIKTEEENFKKNQEELNNLTKEETDNNVDNTDNKKFEVDSKYKYTTEDGKETTITVKEVNDNGEVVKAINDSGKEINPHTDKIGEKVE